ncbi:sporulation phosphorelay system protein KapB [Staphylococcus kloosii]|jgi:kinase-associated protein B|uniref:Kinase-associated lipoprotein B n=1 Tax=Staphylococcus kloosii TaxID=29384 RepID=A0A921H297_9STAP|nr:sporulation phosphorelay system protein KapB [Staphylococcus kloosii]PTJ80114.1 kinase [Staphylococcus kloosii]HJF68763.1 kinase-associated lipoprotein B [Staphylococcus kloosii]
MLYRLAHKTGVYGVSIVEEQNNQILVQVEQVIKHPKQGDLHNPKATENVFFHERKALSQFEKRYTSQSQLKEFNEEPLPYVESLQLAISKLEERLQQKQDEHSRRSLENLQNLKEDYSIQYKEKFK